MTPERRAEIVATIRLAYAAGLPEIAIVRRRGEGDDKTTETVVELMKEATGGDRALRGRVSTCMYPRKWVVSLVPI